MHRLIIAILLVAVSTVPAFAQAGIATIAGGAGTVMGAAKFANGVGLGVVSQGDKSVGALTWHPDLKFGIWGIGLDVNIPTGDSSKTPPDFENVVVRYVEFDTGTLGARYGMLNNITFGYGLLMSNYSTTVRAGTLLNNKQVGLKGYWQGDFLGFEGMGTWSSLYALRVTERVHPLIILGQTAVTDRDGVASVSRTFPSATGYAVDVGFPIHPRFVPFIEYARLQNYGGGLSAGARTGQEIPGLGKLYFTAEYRSLDKNFVPSFFSEHYETNPVDLASAEALGGANKNGFYAKAGAEVAIADNTGAAEIAYESYEKSNPSLTAVASAKVQQPYPITATIGYYQPNFVDARSVDLTSGAVIKGSVGYQINPFTMIVVNYKKAYDPAQGKVVESQTYSAELTF